LLKGSLNRGVTGVFWFGGGGEKKSGGVGKKKVSLTILVPHETPVGVQGGAVKHIYEKTEIEGVWGERCMKRGGKKGRRGKRPASNTVIKKEQLNQKSFKISLGVEDNHARMGKKTRK